MPEKTEKHQRLKREPACIWEKAGVVSRKSCPMDFECTSCRFDGALRHVARTNNVPGLSEKRPVGKRGSIVSWKEKLRELPLGRRPCVHHLKEKISFRACTHDYVCTNCDFDQFFTDQYAVHAVVTPVAYLDARGIKVPQGYYFHRGHTWSKVEEGACVRIGLDDFALRVFGPLDSIEGPLMGKETRQDSPDITLVRGDKSAKVLSPISGVVSSINPRLRDKGSLANQDPYGAGWIALVHSKNLREDLRTLWIHREAQEFFDQEVQRLHEVLEESMGPLTVDGGNLGEDLYGKAPQLGWERLQRLFLHT